MNASSGLLPLSACEEVVDLALDRIGIAGAQRLVQHRQVDVLCSLPAGDLSGQIGELCQLERG